VPPYQSFQINKDILNILYSILVMEETTKGRIMVDFKQNIIGSAFCSRILDRYFLKIKKNILDLLIKGTVRPDWICMRVVPLDGPLKVHKIEIFFCLRF
jgi:hypothetical protein